MQVFERAGGGVQEDERGFVTGLQVISPFSMLFMPYSGFFLVVASLRCLLARNVFSVRTLLLFIAA